MDQPGADAGNLVGGDAGADAAAAERHATLDLARGERSGQGNDEIGIVVREVKRMRAEVKDFVPGTSQTVTPKPGLGERVARRPVSRCSRI
jgi:hypothetical protein